MYSKNITTPQPPKSLKILLHPSVHSKTDLILQHHLQKYYFWQQNTTKYAHKVHMDIHLISWITHSKAPHNLHKQKAIMHPIPFSAAVKGQSGSLMKRVLGLPLTSPWPNMDVATGHVIVSRGIMFLFVQPPIYSNLVLLLTRASWLKAQKQPWSREKRR